MKNFIFGVLIASSLWSGCLTVVCKGEVERAYMEGLLEGEKEFPDWAVDLEEREMDEMEGRQI